MVGYDDNKQMGNKQTSLIYTDDDIEKLAATSLEKNVEVKNYVEVGSGMSPRVSLPLKNIKPSWHTPKLCKIAVQRNGRCLKDVREDLQTTELCLIAVKQYGHNLQMVKKELQTTEMCEMAIHQHGYALAYIRDDLQTPELCKIAVCQFKIC